jgi:hypothetical protein
MRRAGELPFDWIADNTRWMRKPRTYDSMRHMLDLTKQTYRCAICNDQETYIEIWLEKDASAGVLYQETAEWDVPLMGDSRLSISLVSLQRWRNDRATREPAYIYYFGDWDPSGRNITRATEAGLREFAPDAEIHFRRVAVTEGQIQTLRLPTPCGAAGARYAGAYRRKRAVSLAMNCVPSGVGFRLCNVRA